MKYTKSGFSLIELLVGILIVSFIMIAGFQSLSAVGIAKVKLIEKTRIEKEAYFASERFFELIKKGGSIDYEEYWNRYSYNTDYVSGHFENPTGFGNFGPTGNPQSTNFGAGLYYCESGNSVSMGVSGCLEDFNNLNTVKNRNYRNSPQRFGQYELQFIDHNSDSDASGDEDSDGNIVGDADDLYLGIGPEAFLTNTDIGELYLINSEGNERTYFRWNVGIDSEAPTGSGCSGDQIMTGDACLGTIEFLKLVGSDSGYDHQNTGGAGDNDGIVDTWYIHPDFTNTPNTPIIAGNNSENYWQSVFSDTIHVSHAEFYLFPNKDLDSSWRDTSSSIKVAPYVQLHLKLQPSWKEKKKIKGAVPTTEIQTTLQLLDIDLQ
ncbi:prepilin-type N-terminal cleavage/methylation domain-containing protein [Candidatus Gracilibacteria bacterium]|nr:prepilin-type N-terminal cleavage/methylation domain-containing protein [Candidatus Gracilibacteria bacterium]